ncbi:hypothetical protein [Blastococcus sp. CT_GayMR16]|uniref:hypothetical protein n=1 Tax=Blastococcus sp. CT_GayMR16 TaxID=2559607 RepID=UPI00107307E2|nr:hypothetical protein [Blastococcus sp. CT_GayMR16]TFV91146.1 hypothetical protein E4P38_00610 [Blastococcus sp. CT_GayMR16]
MIAVFSHRKGTEADRVIRHLRSIDAPAVRVNMGHGEASVAIGLTPSGTTFNINCDAREVAGSQISAAWLHQLPMEQARHGNPLARVAADSSRLRLWQAVMELVEPSCWLTKPGALQLAANKVLQYSMARKAGLQVPPTVAGNEMVAVVASLGTQVLAKYLGDSAALWSAGDTGHAATTVEIDLSGAKDDSLIASPALYQTKLESERELRVVMIRGESGAAPRVFAAGTSKPAGVLDVRLVDGGMSKYSPCTLPQEVLMKLESLLASLGVGFCSADILVDSEARHWFLDLNATGAWWWIDDLYEGAVTVAIGEALVSKSANLANWEPPHDDA